MYISPTQKYQRASVGLPDKILILWDVLDLYYGVLFFSWSLALSSLLSVRLMYLFIFLRFYYFISYYSSSWGNLCVDWFWCNEFSSMGKYWVDNIPAWYEGHPLLILLTHFYWIPSLTIESICSLKRTKKSCSSSGHSLE